MKVPPRTDYFLTQFTNRRAFHQLDMECFYHFIQAAHQFNARLSKFDVKDILISRGYTEEKSEWLSEIYFHGRKLLANRITLYNFHPPQKES